MKRINIDQEKFDLPGLLEESCKFFQFSLEEGFDPTQAIYSVNEVGGMPTLYDEKRDLMNDLDKGLMLFVPFAIFEDEDGNFPCPDGNTYNVNGNKIDEDEDEDEDEEIEERGFFMGELDIMGFLIAREGNTLNIDTAVCYPGACGGPLPSVDFVEECGILGEPSEEFIRSFVLES